MTSTFGSLKGPGGLESGLDNLLLDLIQSGLEAQSKLYDAAADGLQVLRDLINGNQQRAAHQCRGAQQPQCDRAGNGPGREGVLQMLLKLLLIMMPMLMPKDEADGQCDCEANAMAQKLARLLFGAR